ncbi:cellulose-complementing protein-like [Macrobrachium nipponense]|uniref:cellulose-complementing protein-like n=1 Tax=Macrobrachium nipponense TaxID=159736 RepID=UPI0030C80E75
MAVTMSTITVSVPGYMAPTHWVYTQHVTSMTPSVMVGTVPHPPKVDTFLPPLPGYAVVSPPGTYVPEPSWVPSPLDPPPVAFQPVSSVSVPASVPVPDCVAAAPVPSAPWPAITVSAPVAPWM